MSQWIPVPENFIIIDADKCTGCGNCMTVCGGEVFDMEGKKAVVTRIKDCLECYNCEVVCLPDAIQVCVPKGGTGKIHNYG
jgi:ferredoxin-like protein FixX